MSDLLERAKRFYHPISACHPLIGELIAEFERLEEARSHINTGFCWKGQSVFIRSTGDGARDVRNVKQFIATVETKLYPFLTHC